MAQRLKRWESPRREGRNDKGRGGSARQRQKRKQFQALRQKLKDQSTDSKNNQQNHRGGREMLPPIFCMSVALTVSTIAGTIQKFGGLGYKFGKLSLKDYKPLRERREEKLPYATHMQEK